MIDMKSQAHLNPNREDMARRDQENTNTAGNRSTSGAASRSSEKVVSLVEYQERQERLKAQEQHPQHEISVQQQNSSPYLAQTTETSQTNTVDHAKKDMATGPSKSSKEILYVYRHDENTEDH